MTQTSNRFFDEIGRLMNDAAGAAQGVKREVDTVVRNQAEKILRDLDIVKREEFEAVKDMARLAREENEALKARIAALEAKLGVRRRRRMPAARTRVAVHLRHGPVIPAKRDPYAADDRKCTSLLTVRTSDPEYGSLRSQGRRMIASSDMPSRSRGGIRPRFAIIFLALSIRGRRESRMRAAPAVSCAMKW